MFNKFTRTVGKNFRNPKGILGKISTKIMNLLNRKQYQVVLDNIDLKSGDTILDIGFGNGYLLKKLLNLNFSINAYGIDISKDMVKVASRNNQKYIKKGNLKLFLEDMGNTSFENDFFDKIYTINTIYFWNDIDKCFSEVKRILKPNGIFINVIFTKEFLDKLAYTNYGFNKYNIEEILEMTENNGMNIIKTIEIDKDKSYCIISKIS